MRRKNSSTESDGLLCVIFQELSSSAWYIHQKIAGTLIGSVLVKRLQGTVGQQPLILAIPRVPQQNQ